MTVSGTGDERALAWVLAHPDGGRAARARGLAWLRDPAGGENGREAAERALAEAAPREQEQLAALGWAWLAGDAASFPRGVAELSDPPLGLFVRGALPNAPAVAVVGARQATAYGREVAEYLARELALAGVVIVSGMARGVDAAAHRGALAGGGLTVAVWGAGPDQVYPREHVELAQEIAANGALVSEYPLGSPPRPQHFPERNRIIAGLSGVIVVVEANERSGALITARLALDEGRDVMAVPGSIFSRLSAGPNGLLRAGAAPVLSADDVLAALGLPPRGGATSSAAPGLLAFLPAGEAVDVDHLAATSGLPVAAVLEQVVQLELAGMVARQPDGRYRRAGHRLTT
jgi:DNA processing protein